MVESMKHMAGKVRRSTWSSEIELSSLNFDFLILFEISEWNCALKVVKGITASVTSRVVCDPSQLCTRNSRRQPDPRSHDSKSCSVKCPPIQPLWMQCSLNLTEQEVQSVWNQSRSKSWVKGIPSLSFQITLSRRNTWPGQQAYIMVIYLVMMHLSGKVQKLPKEHLFVKWQTKTGQRAAGSKHCRSLHMKAM